MTYQRLMCNHRNIQDKYYPRYGMTYNLDRMPNNIQMLEFHC